MNKYQGIISIIGKPNVGKSSLINLIFSEKISIVNAKPQTTRNQIYSTFVNDNYAIEFVDTPGFHNEKNKLDAFLNSEVKTSLKVANLVYFLCDPTRNIDDEDYRLLNLVKKYNIPTILVITKMDLVNLVTITSIIDKLSNEFKFVNSTAITNEDSKTVQNLLKISEPYLNLVDLDYQHDEATIQKDLFLVKEIIREQCLNLLHQEVPYGMAILIEDFKYLPEKNEFNISASLNVEKESQKKIVIGVNGSMIKEIGTKSRQELLKIYDTKIFLKLYVKVAKNWRDDNTKLKEFGYSN